MALKLIHISYLNQFSAHRKNLFIIDYRDIEEIRALTLTKLVDKFNVAFLKYDLLNCYKIPNGAAEIKKELIEILKAGGESILLGHSFNGYLAFDLACKVPQVKFLVMIDTRNFLVRDENQINLYKALYKNLIKQVIENKDLVYPFYLLKKIGSKIINRRKTEFDLNFLQGINCFLKDTYPKTAKCDCLFFKASRSSFKDLNFGINWRSFITGNFYLKTIISGHNEMIPKHASQMANEIINQCL